jgi:hypothetical protein
MLERIHVPQPHPISIPVDPSAEFEGGVFAQLKIIGNDIVAGVSDGTAPFGIIDDIRTSAFSKPAVDEVVTIILDDSNITTNPDGRLVSIAPVKEELDNPNIVNESFRSSVTVDVNMINGVITVPAGTELNFDSDNDGVNDSFQIIVNYLYRVTNKPGDDSTLGSGRISIHYQRGWYATDQYDTREVYALNATLYVGLDGKLTPKQPTENHPGIAMVTGPPSAVNSTLQFLLF